MTILKSSISFAAGIAILLSPVVVFAQTDGDWLFDADGNWSDAANWSSDPVVPGGAESVININRAITANRVITIDNDDRTIGILNIGSTDFRRYTLQSSGGASLILDNGESAAVIAFLSSGNANTINAPLVLNSDLIINNQSSSNQTIEVSTLSAGTEGAKTIYHTGTGSGQVLFKIGTLDNSTAPLGLSITSTSDFVLGSNVASQSTYFFENGISVDGGILSLNWTAVLGATDLYLNNASLYRSGTTGGMTLTGNISIGGTFTYNQSGSGSYGYTNFSSTADVQLHSDAVFNINNSSATSYIRINAPISGDFSITKTGDGTLYLLADGAKTFSGGFFQEEGLTEIERVVPGSGDVTLRGGILRFSSYTTGFAFGSNLVIEGEGELQSRRTINYSGDALHSMGTLEIAGQNLTVTSMVSAASTGTQGFSFGTTTITDDAVLTIINPTNNDKVVSRVNLGALQGAGNLTKDGDGILRLTAAAGSYSGTTRVLDGTLEINNASALGGGALHIDGGNAIAVAGSALSVSEILLGGGTYTKSFSNGESFTNYLSATSNFAEGISTSATFLAGSAGGVRTVETSFVTTVDDPISNDFIRASDIYVLSGTGSDIFALQLVIDAVTETHFLGWLSDGEWINAIDGNSATGSSAVQGFLGSYEAAGVFATADYLGSWGVDIESGSVWAILDHNSYFAVVPEPSTTALLLALVSCGGALLYRRRKN